ncbi:MAG TPA: nitroreductase family protein [Solirubrobacteraceae bacterium]|jgi:nitroreductase|nr:nitroreductase family protein [Solirubrobacteraceae bacterium]
MSAASSDDDTGPDLPPAAVAAAERHGVPLGPDAPVMEVMRTMRRLRPDPVPRELLIELLDAATWAPTGGNSQTYGYLIVDDREAIHRCGELWRRHQRFYSASQEPLTPRFSTREKWRELHDTLRYQAERFDETPALVVFTCDLLETYLKAMLRVLAHLPRFMIQGESSSIYPGVENFLIAARAHGLAATLTTWHMLLEPDWRRARGLPRRTKIFAVVPVGWPAGHFGPVARRPASAVTRIL